MWRNILRIYVTVVHFNADRKKEQLSKGFSEKPEPSTKYTPRGDDV